MDRCLSLAICGLLIVALAMPAAADGTSEKRSAVSKVTGTIYKGSASVLDRSERLVSGCLKNCFSFFNPCLDVVKKCTNVVVAPVEYPFDYAEKAWAKRGKKAASKLPAPKKPEQPQQ
jgi:hypothetical protein